MTETEWMTCTDPREMLPILAGRIRERKRRLFAVACCRRIWGRLDEASRRAVEVAELYADGAATAHELGEAHQRVWAFARKKQPACDSVSEYLSDTAHVRGCAAAAAAWASELEERNDWAGISSSNAAVAADDESPYGGSHTVKEAEKRRQADLLRDLIGNLFRPVDFSPSWLSFGGGLVPRIAQGIYAGRSFEDLLILADALEDAGCGNADILVHLRGPRPHVRGCHVLDLLLDKPVAGGAEPGFPRTG